MAWTNPNAPNLLDFLQFVQDYLQVPAAAMPINVPAPASPVLTASATGGALASGTVYVVVTYVTAYGETMASAEASVAVTGPAGQIVVASPAAQGGVIGYNVYAGSASGGGTLQTATPVALGTAYTINVLMAGGAQPPAANTATSPWPGYAFDQAMLTVNDVLCGPAYTLAVYNCAAHILISTAPDLPGQTYFATLRDNFDLLDASSGVISSSSDQGTSNSFSVPPALQNVTVRDLWFFKTPYGRAYLGYAQSFGEPCGLS